jgi:RNA polymerase sigma factor (sigma-70 family)
MVLGLCRLLLHDADEAQDAAQQTFLSAHRSLLSGTRPRKPAVWLAAIARNECRTRIRKRLQAPRLVEFAACAEPVARSSDPIAVASEHENVDALRAAIASLPPRQRQAVVLRHFYGLSYREVGAALGIRVPVVEQLLFRARRRLRDVAGDLPRRLVAPVGVTDELREALARAVPGFESAAGTAGAAAGATVLAKLAMAPAAAKVAATVAAVGVGASAGSEAVRVPEHPPSTLKATPAPAAPVPERARLVDDGDLRSDSGSSSSGSDSSGSGSSGSDSDSSGSGSGSSGSGSDSSGSGSDNSGSDSSGSGSSGSGPSGSDSSTSGSSGPTSSGSGSSGSGSVGDGSGSGVSGGSSGTSGSGTDSSGSGSSGSGGDGSGSDGSGSDSESGGSGESGSSEVDH